MNPWLYIPVAFMGIGFAYKLTLVVGLLLGRTGRYETTQDSEEPVRGRREKARKKSAAA